MDWSESTRGEPGGDQKHAWLNTGTGWVNADANYLFPTDFFYTSGYNTGYSGSTKGALFFDVNGDGQSDLMQSYSYQGNVVTNLWYSNAKPELISNVHTPLGGDTDLQYAASSQFPGPQTIPFPIQVLSQMKNSDGRGNTITTNYSYEQGLYDTQNKEFLGFGKVRTTDAVGNYSYSYYHQDRDPDGNFAPASCYKSRLYKIENYNAAAQLLTWQETRWGMRQPFAGYSVYFLRPDWVKTTIRDLTPYPVTRTDYAYDETAGSPTYGNVVWTTSNGDLSISGDERVEYVEYAANASANLLNFPKRVTILDIQSNTISDTRYFYDGSTVHGEVTKGNATETQCWLKGTTGRWISSKSEYSDPRFPGHLTSVVNPLGKRTNMAYDANGYPSSVTNALSQTITSIYDMRTGNVLSDTDANTRSVTYQYDALGRLVKEIGPLDSDAFPAITYNYHPELLGNASQQMLEKQTRIQYGQTQVHVSKAYFDGLGRQYKNESQADGGKTVIGETTFNNRGLPEKRFLPHFKDDSNVAWSQTVYDGWSRVSQIIHPDNSKTNFTYMNRAVLVQDANLNTQYSESDAYGAVKTRVEPGIQTPTRYFYDTLGNLTQIYDSKGKNTLFTYDSLGRKTSMTDPNAGTWSYTYDDCGNLLTETDARSVQVSFQYDALNRLTQKKLIADPNSQTGQTVGTILAAYTYDEKDATNRPYGIGRLTTIQDPLGYLRFYHDALGRVTRETRELDSQIYTVQTSYDAMNRATQTTYPGGDIVKYVYSSGGHLSQITNANNSVTYASYPSFDARDRALQIDQADGKIKMQFAYNNPQQVLSSFKIESWTTGAPVTVKNWTYEFDPVHNLKKITDVVTPEQIQTFAYDQLNRLTQANGVYGTENYTYDDLGNFQTKGNATYSYTDPAHPYAVTQTKVSGAFAQDNSTIFSWNLDPAEPIYSIKGRVLNSVAAGAANIPVVLMGGVTESVKTDNSADPNARGQFEIRGIAGGVGTIFNVLVASSGFKTSPLSYVYAPLSQNQQGLQFQLTVDTNTLNLSKIRVPRTALADGYPAPQLAGGTFTGGLIWALTYSSMNYSAGGAYTNWSGYSPEPNANDLLAQPTAQIIAPPVPTAQSVVGPGFVDGINSKALQFNGTSDIFSVSNGNIAVPSNAATLMIWVKPAGYPTSGYGTLLSKTPAASIGAAKSGLRLLINTAGKVVFELGQATAVSKTATSAKALELNQWTFICATYDGSNLRLFINGLQEVSTVFAGSIIPNSAAVTLGASQDTNNILTAATFFQGMLDEPRIHNRVWTQGEILRAQDQLLGSASYAYDANGNLISKDAILTSWTYQYDSSNHLTRINKGIKPQTPTLFATFAYDASGSRIKKTGPEGTTLYIGNLFEVRPGGVSVSHIFGGSQMVADLVHTGTATAQAYYYQPDHLGSTALISDSNGATLQSLAYRPFGETAVITGNSPIHHKYTGQEEDLGTELYFYNSRFYSPVLGRFISLDPIVPDLYDPQTLNRFAYVRNNPIILTDPDGHNPWVVAAVIFAAAIWGGTHGHPFDRDAWAHFDPMEAGISGVQAGVYVAALPEGPAVAGALASMTGTTLRGGSTGDLVKSGVVGYATGWAIGKVPIPNNALAPLARVAAGTGAGGVSSVLMGGSLTEGMTQGFQMALLNETAVGVGTRINRPSDSTQLKVSIKQSIADLNEPTLKLLRKTENPNFLKDEQGNLYDSEGNFVGKPGKNAGVYHSSDVQAAKTFFEKLLNGNTSVEVKPGVWVGNDQHGNVVTYRQESGSGGPAVDIHSPGVRRIHYQDK